jgi:hypothetical protein
VSDKITPPQLRDMPEADYDRVREKVAADVAAANAPEPDWQGRAEAAEAKLAELRDLFLAKGDWVAPEDVLRIIGEQEK